jgi:hypothetical protein
MSIFFMRAADSIARYTAAASSSAFCDKPWLRVTLRKPLCCI